MLVNQTTSLSPKEINDHIHSIIETKSQLNELETKVNSVLNEGQCKKLTSTLELKMTILKFHSDFKENFLETSANKAHLLAFDTLSLGYIFENHFLVDKLFREEQDQKIKEIWQKLNTFFIIPEYEKAKEFIKDSSPPGPNQINEHIHDIINTKSELRHLGTEIDALTINRREEKKKTLTALLKTKITILKFYFEFETDALKNSAGKIDVPAFDVLNLPAIFENHYLLHKLTNEEQDEKIKELWQNLTTLFVIPHYKNAKNFLTASSYVYITKNAAQRGRALTNYFKALPLFEKRKILINLEGSDNLVAINEKNGKSVIKKQPQIGEIEEKRIEDLAFFYTVDGFAPSFTIRNKRRNYVDILELKKLRPSRSLLIKHFNRRFLHAV